MLFRFQVELSDVDRGVYETLDLRVAKHPSEIAAYLLSRVLAYALSYQDNLEFVATGLSDPEAPALRALGNHGAIEVWIEIGNPSARKLHRASKAADQVVVYTYKNPNVLVQEIKGAEIHRVQDLKIYSFDPKFLEDLETTLEKNNRWTLLHQQGHLDLSTKEQTLSGEVKRISF